jgi:hypothetical protein
LPREGAVIFRELEGKLAAVRIECPGRLSAQVLAIYAA